MTFFSFLLGFITGGVAFFGADYLYRKLNTPPKGEGPGQ